MPSKHLNIALEVLSDMVKNPLFDSKELEKERKVIFEEIKMRKDNPRIYVLDQIHGQLYEKPFGIPLIGTEKTMNSIDRKKILEKFKNVYTPNNMILAIVGNADFDKIVEFAEKNFGKEKKEILKPKILIKNEIETQTRKGIDQANLVLAYHAPLISDKKVYASLVLNTLMGGGMSSRLFSEIREKRNLAYSVKGESNINKDYSYNLVYVGTTKENVEPVKKLILQEFKKAMTEFNRSSFSGKENILQPGYNKLLKIKGSLLIYIDLSGLLSS